MKSRSLRDSTGRGTKTLAILGLVLMVAFAGCSGLNPVASQNPSFDGKQTEENVTYPDGFSQSGIDDPEKVNQNHNKALSEIESLTLNISFSGTYSGTEITGSVVSKADVENKRGRLITQSEAMGQTITHYEIYQNDEMKYRMDKSNGNEPTYEAYEEQFNLIEENESTGINPWLGNASFGEAEEVKRDGETMLRYHSNSTSNADAFLFEDTQGETTADEFNATMIVDQNGIIHSFTYSMTYTTSEGTNETIQTTYQVNAIDSTSVEKPDWVEEAKSQSM